MAESPLLKASLVSTEVKNGPPTGRSPCLPVAGEKSVQTEIGMSEFVLILSKILCLLMGAGHKLGVRKAAADFPSQESMVKTASKVL